MGDNLPEVDLGEDFEAAGVTCGLDHSCAWSRGGKLKCWGGNDFGQVRYTTVPWAHCVFLSVLRFAQQYMMF